MSLNFYYIINLIKTKKMYEKDKIRKTIMLPIFQTSKTTFLISPHYDAFRNSFSPFGAKILAA